MFITAILRRRRIHHFFGGQLAVNGPGANGPFAQFVQFHKAFLLIPAGKYRVIERCCYVFLFASACTIFGGAFETDRKQKGSTVGDGFGNGLAWLSSRTAMMTRRVKRRCMAVG